MMYVLILFHPTTTGATLDEIEKGSQNDILGVESLEHAFEHHNINDYLTRCETLDSKISELIQLIHDNDQDDMSCVFSFEYWDMKPLDTNQRKRKIQVFGHGDSQTHEAIKNLRELLESMPHIYKKD